MGIEYILTAERLAEGIKYSPSDSLRENPFLEEELEEAAKKLLIRNPKRKSAIIKIIGED